MNKQQYESIRKLSYSMVRNNKIVDWEDVAQSASLKFIKANPSEVNSTYLFLCVKSAYNEIFKENIIFNCLEYEDEAGIEIDPYNLIMIKELYIAHPYKDLFFDNMMGYNYTELSKKYHIKRDTVKSRIERHIT